ncbi:putative nucleotidyltransferase, ribonuclease H [Tanacetum coccineum]
MSRPAQFYEKVLEAHGSSWKLMEGVRSCRKSMKVMEALRSSRSLLEECRIVHKQGRFEAMAIETEKNAASGSTVVDENRGRDDVRQNPKKRGTSKDVVASLDQRVAGVETSMAELKNQVEGLEGLDSDFASMREDFREALNTLSGDLKRELHDLRDSFMGEITKIREEFGEEVSTLHQTIENLQADVALCKRSLASSGSNTNHGPKIDVPKPSPFVGKREARAVDDFLWEMEQYLEGVNMVDDTSKIKMATRYLKDTAALWWRRRYGDIERGTATIDTWAEFVADFKKQFYPENAKNEAKSRLRKLKQSGTIREYVKEFTTLVLEIPELSDQDSLFYFLDGLQGWAKTELERRGVQDLSTAIAQAEALIDFSTRRDSSKPKDKKVNQEKGRGEKNAQPKVNVARKPPTGKDKNLKTSYKNGGCFICDGPHRARDCPKKASLNGMSAHDDEEASDGGSMGSIRILNAIKAKTEVLKVIGKGLQYVEATINGVKVRALVDSGATHNFVADDEAKRIGINATKGSGTIKVVNSPAKAIHRVAKDVRAKIGEWEGTIDLSVVPMDDFKVVIGLEFFDKTCMVSTERDAKSGAKTLSAMQFKKGFNKSEPCYLAVTRLETDGGSSKVEVPKVIERVLDEFKDVMPKELPKKLPPRRELDHTIELKTGSKPLAKAPYRMPPPELEELRNQLKELMNVGYIRPSKAPYAALVLFQRKKDGSLRMCIDYRALNKVTIKNKYHIPLIADLFDHLGKARYFTKLDLRSGYCQVRIAEGDEAKTTCVTRYGSYEFSVMPFGLTNAPMTFCTLMNKLFHPFFDKFMVVYLDDIVVYSHTLEDHVLHLKQVFQVLQGNELYVKLEKCSFAQDEVELLGHKIKDGGLMMDGAKIKAIQDWEPPTNVMELRSFLGLVNYYRRFIMGYSTIASPLTDLLKKNKAWIWDEECQAAFETEFDYQLEYKSGKANVVADALSHKAEFAAITQAQFFLQDRIKEGLEHDPLAKKIIALAKDGRTQRFWLKGDMLFTKGDRLYVSKWGDLRRPILKECHDSKWAGHSGIIRTLALVEGTYYWPKMGDDVKTFVRTCLIYQQDKIEQKKSGGLLKPLPTPKGPWESVSMDFITCLPKSEGGGSIIVVVDRFSKYETFIAAPPDITADATAKLFFKNVVKYWGVPHVIISDRDPRFTGLFWTELFKIMGTDLNFSMSFHLQTDGQTERVNALLELYLRHYVSANQHDWAKLLDVAQFSYNMQRSEATRKSPFELVTGHQPLTPNALAASYKGSSQAAKKMKKWANAKRRHVEFEVGDQVMVKLLPQQFKSLRKVHKGLIRRYEGPFSVIGRVGKVFYRVQLPPKLKIHPVFHVSFLKPYHGDEEDPERGVSKRAPTAVVTSYDREVEEILSDRTIRRRGVPSYKEYLIKWLDLPDSEASWEAEDLLWQFTDEIKRYHEDGTTRTSRA